MSRPSRKRGDLRASSVPDDYLGYSRTRERKGAGRVIYISTYLPRPVARRARREIYPYPFPKQVQKRGRVIRFPLRRKRDLVPVKVAIRLPRHLPLVRASYVAVTGEEIAVHSYNKVKGVIDAQEFNRRRYSEYKGNHRKARYGQLDSRGSQRFGSVAETHRRGGTIDEIADAALVARALSKR